MHRRVSDILNYVKGPDVLDIGCAGGSVEPNNPDWLHGRLRKAGLNIWGIDISEKNIEVLRSLGFDNIFLQNGDSFDLNRTFDCVVAGDVIEHVSNAGNFIHCIRKHLKPDGRAIITTPYAFCLMHVLYAMMKYPKTCGHWEHAALYCPTTITQLAEREKMHVEHLILTDYWDPTTRDLSYRAYWLFMRTVGRLLPERVKRTTILCVLKPQAR